MKTTCQRLTSLTHPAKVRASNIPSNSPVITMPRARPRFSCETSDGAMGSATWVTEAKSPTSALAAMRKMMLGAKATLKSASDTAANMRIIRARRSTTSPSGTSRKMPIA